MKNILVIGAAICLGAVGCTTTQEPPQTGPVLPTYEAKSLAMTELLEQLFSDPRFASLYADAKAIAESRGQKLPVIAIMRIEDNTVAGGSDRVATGQIFRELQIALGRTGKFRVMDYELLVRRTDVENLEADIGVRADNADNFGNYASMAFLMTAEIRMEGDAQYFLNAQLTGPDGSIAADASVPFGK